MSRRKSLCTPEEWRRHCDSSMRWYRATRDVRIARRAAIRSQRREHWRRVELKRIRGLKERIFELLGDRCARCGFSDPRALQVDHKKAGAGGRDGKYRSGHPLYAAILRGDKNPADFQILCANCNWIKSFENKERCVE